MNPCKLTNPSRTLGKPNDWNDNESACGSLDIYDEYTENGNFMISAWELSEDELETLMNTRTVYLGVRGIEHPVVSLTV